MFDNITNTRDFPKEEPQIFIISMCIFISVFGILLYGVHKSKEEKKLYLGDPGVGVPGVTEEEQLRFKKMSVRGEWSNFFLLTYAVGFGATLNLFLAESLEFLCEHGYYYFCAPEEGHKDLSIYAALVSIFIIPQSFNITVVASLLLITLATLNGNYPILLLGGLICLMWFWLVALSSWLHATKFFEANSNQWKTWVKTGWFTNLFYHPLK